MKKNCNNCGFKGDNPGVCSTCVTENRDGAIPSNWTPIDNVNHPNHYQTKSGLETIDVIDAFTNGLDGIEAFDTGNIIKYICRWKKKNGIEDLKKAKWYLENLINHLEKEN